MGEIEESDNWHNAVARFTEEPAVSVKPMRPNIFNIAGFPRRETVSSNVLAYFFDPAEDHGLKDMMLKALLRVICKKWVDESEASVAKEVLDALESDAAAEMLDASVATEESTDNRKRIDILLDLPDISIAIENKVDSYLYNDLSDYRHRAEEAGNPAIVVVLHPSDNFVLEGHPSAQGLVVGRDLFDVHYDELFQSALRMLGEYSLDADPRAVDLLQQYIDNYSPERKQKMMDNADDNIKRFVAQADGVEQQLLNLHQSYDSYTDAVYDKLQKIHEDLISQWEGDIHISGVVATLVDSWEYPKAGAKHRLFHNKYCAQSFELENSEIGRITFEFFFNVEFDDGYARSEPNSGDFNTIWYKAYWGGRRTKQKPKTQITNPYNQRLQVKLTDPEEDIKEAVNLTLEKVLKAGWKL